MERMGVLGVAVLMIGCVLTPSLVGANGNGWDKWLGSGGWGMDAPYHRCYDPTRMATFAGQVTQITTTVPMPGMAEGVALLLTLQEVSVPVQLGPVWYIEHLDTRIEVGDRIEVVGAKGFAQGLPAVIAAEVRKGDSVLVLRNAAGTPVWAGWRRVR